MSYLLKTLIVVLCFAGFLFGQNTGKISGTVTDAQSKEPIPGATVVVKGTTMGASTNPDGSYFILNVSPGEYEVSVSMVGFQSVVQQQVIVNTNRTTTVDYSLQQTTVDLPEVMIIAKRPDVERDKTTSSLVVRTEDIQAIASVTNLNDVLTLSSDVQEGHFRGGREGEELYNIEGMSIVNPLNNSTAFAPMVSAMEEVEVITSGFGAQYGNAQSGVVNISMKEAQQDRWRARLETRTRVPALKHWGPSIFDSSANPYLKLLDSPEEWMGTNVFSTEGQRYYGTIGNGFENRYGQDTVTLAQIAYTLYMLQGRRDLNKQYDGLLDYNSDFTIGGPISNKARMFLATRYDNTWPMVPTDEPNTKRQVMGNVVYDIGSGKTLRLLGTYSLENTHLFRSQRTNGLLNWLWDRILGVSYAKEENTQFGLRFSNALSSMTYYDLKLSALTTMYRDGSPVTEPSGYSGDYNKIIWGRYDKTPDQLNVAAIDDDYRDEYTRTISFDGSLSSQVTNGHQLFTGLQANLYTINVANRSNIRSDETERREFYQASPYEAGLFLQDKMEFEGMIANVGLRWDLWNQNVEYFKDIYSPFRVYTDSGLYIYDQENAPRESTPLLGRLQPRIGLSFPISLTTVFHLNYGSFVQRPSFERTISSQLPRIGFVRMQIGNPLLLPQETNSYDVGFAQGFGDGLTLDVSGYYKDVKNLIQRAFFYDVTQTMYSTYVNRDYADIRGFRIALMKREGLFTGSINYTYGVATGKSSTPFNASPIYRENPPQGLPAKELPDPKDILMDFDRTHNLILNLTLVTDEHWGFSIGNIYPFENTSIGISSFARSGRPYTYARANETEHLVNNKRTPAEYNTKVKISRKFQRVFGTTMTFYVEINNLFDQQIYSYNSVFQSATTATGGSYVNRNLTKYEEEQDKLRYFDDFDPFIVDQTFLLYDNMPRSINVGLVLNF